MLYIYLIKCQLSVLSTERYDVDDFHHPSYLLLNTDVQIKKFHEEEIFQ